MSSVASRRLIPRLREFRLAFQGSRETQQRRILEDVEVLVSTQIQVDEPDLVLWHQVVVSIILLCDHRAFLRGRCFAEQQGSKMMPRSQ
jgi:hypothetical protein